MSIKTHLVAAGGALLIGASGAWWAQAQRYGLQIEKLEHKATSTELTRKNQVVEDIAGFQKGFNDALSKFQNTQQRNDQAQQGVAAYLRDLRTVTAGLHGDFAQLPGRIEHAARGPLAQYARTCTALLENLADRGERMAERGAGIARAADGHSADTGLMQDAWPKAGSPTPHASTRIGGVGP